METSEIAKFSGKQMAGSRSCFLLSNQNNFEQSKKNGKKLKQFSKYACFHCRTLQAMR